MGSVASSPMSHDQDLLLELLKQKQEEAFKIIDYYRAAVTTFLLITGGLLKFALDQNSNIELRRGFGTLGIGMGVLGLLATALAEKHRRILKEEICYFSERLMLNLPANKLQVQAYTILVVSLLFLSSILGWIFVLLT